MDSDFRVFSESYLEDYFDLILYLLQYFSLSGILRSLGLFDELRSGVSARTPGEDRFRPYPQDRRTRI